MNTPSDPGPKMRVETSDRQSIANAQPVRLWDPVKPLDERPITGDQAHERCSTNDYIRPATYGQYTHTENGQRHPE